MNKLKNSEPLVSILVLTYNHESSIKECLLSLFAVDYSNLEIFVLDDGSSDKTFTIATSVCESAAHHVICETQENTGKPSINSQRLLNKAGGKYVVTIAGDDLLLGCYPLKSIIRLMESSKNLAVSFPRQIPFSTEGDYRFNDIYDNELIELLRSGDSSRVLNEHLYRKVSRLFLQGAVFNREKLELFGWFDTKVIADDYALIFRLFIYLQEYKLDFYFFEKALWLYRLHGNNTHRNQVRQQGLIFEVVVNYVPETYLASFQWDYKLPMTFEDLLLAHSVFFSTERNKEKIYSAFAPLLINNLDALAKANMWGQVEKTLMWLGQMDDADIHYLNQHIVKGECLDRYGQVWFTLGSLSVARGDLAKSVSSNLDIYNFRGHFFRLLKLEQWLIKLGAPKFTNLLKKLKLKINAV